MDNSTDHTGGGWGGAIISLVETSKANQFLDEVKSKYGPYQGLSEEKVKEAAFATPGCGAGSEYLDWQGHCTQLMNASLRRERRPEMRALQTVAPGDFTRPARGSST